jgi:hypothetical protein
MDGTSWYDEASLVAEGHVFCAGSLAQCVRRWARLTDDEQAGAIVKLHKPANCHLTLGRDDIALLAIKPELLKV